MALPANADTGLVTGRFIVGVVDGPDADAEPDAIPAQGTVTFTASVPYLPNPTATPAPVTILKAPIVGVLDGDGHLCVPDPADPLKAGARGVRLVATDDPDLSVQGWTWTVTYNFATVNGARPQIASHAMALPTGATIDLTSVVKVPSSTGIGIEQAEALAASAQAAAQQAAQAATAATEAAQATDAGVATLVASGGATTAVLDTHYRRGVSPAEYGAVGDGIADDTAAVQAAVSSGNPVMWGNSTHRITATIAHTATAPVVWRADGARIILDSPTPIQRAVSIEAAGHPVDISGGLAIDAARKACVGLFLSSNVEGGSDCLLAGVRVSNVHRSSNTFAGGEGIWVRGGFKQLTLDRPVVDKVTMAAGAATSGTQGVTGITVATLGRFKAPHDVSIISPFVNGVLSEDPAYGADQDGIKIFAAEDTPGVDTPYEMKIDISGGTIRNCGGRAVKTQAEWTSVRGMKVFRGAGRPLGVADFDFQVGGGSVSDVSVQYEGGAPSAVVLFNGPATAGKIIPHGSVSGLKVLTTGAVVPEVIVRFNQRADLRSSVTVRDIECVGTQPVSVLDMNGVSGGVHHAILSDVVAAPTSALVRARQGEPAGWTGSLLVQGCVNTGTPVPVMLSISGAASNPTVQAAQVVGFTS